jgi:acyl carrier protein
MTTPSSPSSPSAPVASDAFPRVVAVLVSTLGLQEDRAAAFTPGTPLFGNLPELDSLAVVQIVYALEEEFGMTIEGDEVTGDIFETLGSLAAFVQQKQR